MYNYKHDYFFTASIRGLKDLNYKYIGNYPFKVTKEEVYLDNPDKNMKLFDDMEEFMKGYSVMIMKVLSMKKPQTINSAT